MMRRLIHFLPAAFCVACASAAPAPTAASDDALHVDQVAIIDQSLTGFTAEARMTLTNPSNGAMQISGASWQLSLDGKVVASGTTDLDLSATAGQNLSFRVPASAEIVHDGDELQALVARGDTPIPLLMQGQLKVSTNGKASAYSFQHAGELRAPRLPVPKMNDADLGRSDEDVTVSLYLGIQNQNPFEVKVKQISYKAEVDGTEVGSGIASNGDRLQPSQTAEYPIRENLTTLDRSKTQIPYHLTGSIDLGLVQVPIDLTGTMNFTNKPAAKAKKKHRGAN